MMGIVAKIVVTSLSILFVYSEDKMPDKRLADVQRPWWYRYPYTMNNIEKHVFLMVTKLQKKLEMKKATYDGHIGIFPAEVLNYVSFASHTSIRNVVEIGFNAGHSAVVLLASNPNIKLTSFTFQAVDDGVDFVKHTFLSQFDIVMGPSQITVKKWLPSTPKGFIDLMVIDGNHTYPAPREDFLMLLSRAHIGTRYIFDGVTKDCDDVVAAGWAAEIIRGSTTNWYFSGQDEASIGKRDGMQKNNMGTHGCSTSWCMGVIIKLPEQL